MPIPYQYVFMRAKNILKTRYNIDLIDLNLDISIWLKQRLSQDFSSELGNQEKFDLKQNLESIRRKQPTKFYLLEQDLIKYIRGEMKKDQRPIIRDVHQNIEKIDLDKVTKDDSDDDFEASDASGFIYS